MLWKSGRGNVAGCCKLHVVQFLVFAPLSVLVGLVFFFEHVWSLAWLCLQFLHFLIQVAHSHRLLLANRTQMRKP